jgi:hypothetical protein
MIILKPIIFYDNFEGCEATWVDRTQAPDTEVEATFDEEGNELTPASTTPGAVTDIQLKCHSYHPTQMAMLRADALSFGTSLAEYNDDINGMESNYVAPPPAPIPVPQVITIRQAKLVLLAAGLLDDVDAAVAQADRATQIEWEYATEVNRQWPTLITLSGLIGLDAGALDELFIAGSQL